MVDESRPDTPDAGDALGVGAPMSAFQQLTQIRVPLDDAGEAFSLPDANGRLPIVVLPRQPFRIRNELVIGGAIAIVVGILLDLNLGVRGALVGLGVLALFLGVFQAFIVAVPEGARAVLLRSGRYHRTVGPGRHIVPPWIVVSHVVTMREIPFDAASLDVPTHDDIRVGVELLVTFTIVEPEKFVFLISAPDFDQVCQAACLDAIWSLVRAKTSDQILDLGATDMAALGAAIGDAIAPYGVVVGRVVVTRVAPPAEYMASRQGRRLAVVQREEQAERHALEERLQADRDALKRQRIVAQQERIELRAANETLRLRHLEDRLAAYPNAVRKDVLDERLAVAQSLASNTRAMVQLGGSGDIAEALVVHTLADGGDDAVAPPSPAARGRRREPDDG